MATVTIKIGHGKDSDVIECRTMTHDTGNAVLAAPLLRAVSRAIASHSAEVRRYTNDGWDAARQLALAVIPEQANHLFPPRQTNIPPKAVKVRDTAGDLWMRDHGVWVMVNDAGRRIGPRALTGDLLEHYGPVDVVAYYGSADGAPEVAA